MEDFCRQICHVTVQKDEKRFNDPDVGGETGGEGSDDAVDNPDKDAPQGHHKEAQEAQDDVRKGDFIKVSKLFKQVVENLEETQRRERKAISDHRGSDQRLPIGVPT